MAYKRKYNGGAGGRYRKLVRTGMSLAGRIGGSYIQSYFKKKIPRETGVTSQYDKVTQYSRKSMPRAKKRRWRKFVQKVQAVNDKTLGTRTVVFNETLSVVATAGLQGYGAAALYGFCGNTDGQNVGFRDIYRICNKDSAVMTPSTDGRNASKVTFMSGIIDFTFRNNGSHPLEVDLYEINVMTDHTGKPNFGTTITESEDGTNDIPGATTSLRLLYRGVTLFDLPNAISKDKWKIYKKKKFFLPVGNTATHQHRDPRNHIFNATDINILEGDRSYARRKMTQLYVFVAKNIIGTDSESVNLQVGVTRKYSYCINEASKALDSYNP